MSILGLDCGTKGAYVERFDNSTFTSIRWKKVPPGEILGYLKAARFAYLKNNEYAAKAYVEPLSFRTGDGQKSGIDTMIKTAGGQEMLLTLAGFEIEYVDCKTWQPEFGLAGLSNLTNQEKQKHYVAKVLELYGVKVTQEEGSAVLIATYGWRKEHGELTHGRTIKGSRLQCEGRTGQILWESRQKA